MLTALAGQLGSSATSFLCAAQGHCSNGAASRTEEALALRAQIDTTYNGNIQAKQPDVLPNYDVKTDWRCVFNYDGGTATSTFSGNGRLQEAGCPHNIPV